MAEVITFFGRLADRNNCRYIKDSFYEKGVECFEVNGQWHRINNSKIGYDCETKTWRLVEELPLSHYKILLDLQYEIIPVYGYKALAPEDLLGYVRVARDFHESKNTMQMTAHIHDTLERGLSAAEALENYSVYERSRKGKAALKSYKEWYVEIFKPKLLKSLEQIESSEYMNYYGVLCEKELALSLGHIEYPEDGIFYLGKRLDANSKKTIGQIKTYPLKHYGRDYTTVGHRRESETQAVSSIFANKLPSHEVDRLVARFVPYMYGIEHETIKGFIAEERLPKVGLLPLRDGSLELGGGSLAGIEYTTIPMQGEMGLRLLREQCRLLTKHCEVNNKCALHIHLSGFPLKWAYVMNLYQLCYTLQDEMYSLFPLYKIDSVGVIGASKNYTAPLMKFAGPKDLFKYLSGNMDDERAALEGMSFNSTSNVKKISLSKHPQGDQKWNRPGRYHWANFEPIVFSGPQTFEMRLHTPTTNYTKIVSWLLICSALLKYAEKWQPGEKVTLQDVLKAHFLSVKDGEPLYDFLQGYINLRKSWYEGQKDPQAKLEIAKDKNFEYSTKTISL